MSIIPEKNLTVIVLSNYESIGIIVSSYITDLLRINDAGKEL